MLVQDARTEERHPLRIPIRFCSADGSGSEGTSYAEAANVSRSGLYMTSTARLKVGAILMLVMRVPTEISGSVFSELRCMGRVIHSQPARDGKHGYGVKIEAIVPRHLLPSPRGTKEGWSRRAM